MKFFSPDSLHINTRNFDSVFTFIREGRHYYEQHAEINHLISRYGDYTELPAEMQEEYQASLSWEGESLLDRQSNGINLFDICRGETLSYVCADPTFSKIGKEWSRDEIFDFLYKNYRIPLIKNLSVASFWIKYWNNFIQNSSNFDFALIFSGSLSYARSLMELLRKTPTRVFLLESFMTGSDFYCEEKFSPLPNNSLLGNKNYYSSLKISDESYERDRMKAINKILLGKNLNVIQPPSSADILFDNEKVILILGQVVNDFSQLGYNDLGISSISIYCELLEKILDKTEYKIIFKAHPWENKKANLRSPITANYIKSKFANYIDDRIVIVEDYNIDDLFKQVQHVILLNSQSGIEAAWNGIKPIVLARPFYGKKGFTHDFHYNDIDAVVDFLNCATCEDSTLSLKEFDAFEDFLVKALMYTLVCKHKSGLIKLREIFRPFNTIQMVSTQTAPSEKKSNITDLVPLPLLPQELGGIKDLTDQSPKPISKKLLKLKRNPKRFFNDSKNPLYQMIAKTLYR